MANVSPNKVRTTIILPRTLKSEVDALSKQHGATFTAFVRTAVENHIAMKKAQAQ
ncbi:ribbon-helix-helix domain-containing protein [Caballeronia sp. SBC1]|uniref:ribbon-helix-helix domain-containing protein n=1 Tax=Caballeronia sp. SBC1 TaxID=2705548 RepID=UPI00140A8133|nr:ribbon-helix-helix domain-containing protein [Caballeronia sp. SBC1]